MSLRARVTAWADAHLIPEWRWPWKIWSIAIAPVFGLIVAYFSDPGNAAAWVSTLYGMPPEIRKLIPGVVFLVLTFVPTIVRLWSQRKKPPVVPPSA
jgi:hypothetical protein